MNDWNIQSRSRSCVACEQPFEDGAAYHSLLFATKHELQRKDLCQPCWTQHQAQKPESSENYLSHWQGRFQSPPPPAPEAIQRDTAETLLRKLTSEDFPQYKGAQYILAVMLERKRILKVQDQFKQDGQRIFVYEHPKSGDVFTIAEPDLNQDPLEKIQKDVTLLMEQGLPVEGAETTPKEGTNRDSIEEEEEEASTDSETSVTPALHE